MKIRSWCVGLVSACSIAAIVSWGSVARAQTPCDAILAQPLIDVVKKETSAAQALHDYMCSHDYDQVKRDFGAQAEASYKMFDGSASFSENNFRESVRTRCEQHDKSSYQSGFQFRSQTYLTNDQVGAWSRCMATLQFACYPVFDSRYAIIRVTMNDADPYVVKDAAVTNSAKITSGASVVTPGTDLPQGTQSIILERRSAAEIIAFHMNIVRRSVPGMPNKGQECSLSIPGMNEERAPPNPRIEACALVQQLPQNTNFLGHYRQLVNTYRNDKIQQQNRVRQLYPYPDPSMDIRMHNEKEYWADESNKELQRNFSSLMTGGNRFEEGMVEIKNSCQSQYMNIASAKFDRNACLASVQTAQNGMDILDSRVRMVSDTLSTNSTHRNAAYGAWPANDPSLNIHVYYDNMRRAKEMQTGIDNGVSGVASSADAVAGNLRRVLQSCGLR